jgi:hypothetical protein
MTPPPEPNVIPTTPKWWEDPAHIAKFITALVGAASLAVTQGLIEGTAAKWVAIIIGVATALGVYVVPNKT